MKKSYIATLAAAFFLAPSLSHAFDVFSPNDLYSGKGVTIFKEKELTNKNGFRIPAIAAGGGVLIAASDARYEGGADIVAGDKDNPGLYKTKVVTKISYDGGLTWSDIQIHNADPNAGESDYMSLSSDPALVYDEKTGTALMFALRNNVNLFSGKIAKDKDQMVDNEIMDRQHTSLIMYRSKDGGKTWESKDIHDDLLKQVNVGNTGSKKFSIVFQGPGGGMTYKGKIYVPIQAWAHKINVGSPNIASGKTGSAVMTSGFMVSEDGGETWTASSMLIQNVDKKLDGTDKTINTSESNVFYHKGKIHIAVKDESQMNNNNPGKRRLAFSYDEDTRTWTQVDESFIPENVSQCESSTYSLNEDVYIVGYVVGGRENPTIATNTGVKLQLAQGGSLGYSSITADDNNIYALYEAVTGTEIALKAIDWKHRDYASLNTQIRDRANTLNYMQSKFASESNYMSGSFGNDTAGAEIVGSSGPFKGGFFASNRKGLNEDNNSVSEYDSYDFAFLAGFEHSLFDNGTGNLMFGYMNSSIDYANGSENDVNSIVGGYSIDFKGDLFGWRSGVNFILSDNKVERNRAEGLGKTAEFDSSSISLTNELYKELSLDEFGSLELAGGMVNTFFKHDGFREKGGEGTDEFGQQGANNATFKSNSMQSHELYVKAAWDSKPIALSDFANLSFNSDVKYAFDLADSDDWKEEYHTFSVDRTYSDIGELYSARDGGFFTASLGADVEILKKINIGIKTQADTAGDFRANLEAKVRL